MSRIRGENASTSRPMLNMIYDGEQEQLPHLQEVAEQRDRDQRGVEEEQRL